MDETGLDCKRDTSRLKLASASPCPRVFKSPCGETHTTFVCGIGITEWEIHPMVIVKIKSIVSELSVHYGFPSSSHAEIVSSTSVYINEWLFSHWVTNVLVPSIRMRHHALQLPEDAPALLILDGCYAHSKEILMALQEHHIAFHFLPPHSSHITQPLD